MSTSPLPLYGLLSSKVQQGLRLILGSVPGSFTFDPAELPADTPPAEWVLLGKVKQIYISNPCTPKFYGLWGSAQVLAVHHDDIRREVLQSFQLMGSAIRRPGTASPFRYAVQLAPDAILRS